MTCVVCDSTRGVTARVGDRSGFRTSVLKLQSPLHHWHGISGTEQSRAASSSGGQARRSERERNGTEREGEERRGRRGEERRRLRRVVLVAVTLFPTPSPPSRLVSQAPHRKRCASRRVLVVVSCLLCSTNVQYKYWYCTVCLQSSTLYSTVITELRVRRRAVSTAARRARGDCPVLYCTDLRPGQYAMRSRRRCTMRALLSCCCGIGIGVALGVDIAALRRIGTRARAEHSGRGGERRVDSSLLYSTVQYSIVQYFIDGRGGSGRRRRRAGVQFAHARLSPACLPSSPSPSSPCRAIQHSHIRVQDRTEQNRSTICTVQCNVLCNVM